jgi:hypothetical protein
MAIGGALKVDCGEVFPHGVGIVGGVEPLADFNASTKANRVQARDKDLPVWSVEVLDSTRKRGRRLTGSRSLRRCSQSRRMPSPGCRSVRWCWRG